MKRNCDLQLISIIYVNCGVRNLRIGKQSLLAYFSEHADHADKTSSLFQGTDTFRIEPLQAHNRSPEHIACELKHARVRHFQSESQSETHSSSQPLGPMDKVLQKLDHEADMQLQFKFNTAYHISKYKLAFSHMGPLNDLQEKNGVKMGERYRNDKKAKEFIHSIADVETARIADQVASARFISVLFDGSSDNSITEQEVYVICEIRIPWTGVYQTGKYCCPVFCQCWWHRSWNLWSTA